MSNCQANRVLKRTGIDWDEFYRMAGERAVYTIDSRNIDAAISAASYRGYKTETMSNGDDTAVLLVKRNRPTDKLVTDLIMLDEKKLKAIHAAAVQAGLIGQGGRP